MKIVSDLKPVFKSRDSLKPGEVFKYQGRIHLATEPVPYNSSGLSELNAVDLETGLLCFVHGLVNVQPYQFAELSLNESVEDVEEAFEDLYAAIPKNDTDDIPF